MKFGDIVINHAASKDNPTRIGIIAGEVYRYGAHFYRITNGKGEFWTHDKSGEHCHLEIIGQIDLTPYFKYLEAI